MSISSILFDGLLQCIATVGRDESWMHVHIIWAEHVFLSAEHFAEMTDTIAEICEVLYT